MLLVENRRFTHRGMRKYMAGSRARHQECWGNEREQLQLGEQKKVAREDAEEHRAKRRRSRRRLLHATSPTFFFLVDLHAVPTQPVP